MLTYSQVTFENLRDELGITVERRAFLPALTPVA